MVKKGLLVLALAVFLTGWSFAEPKNTVTVDIAPAIFGLASGPFADSVGDMASDGDVVFGLSGFGIGAQFERELFSLISVAGRFAYARANMDNIKFQQSGLPTDADAILSSYSVEGHVRVYPFLGTFFVDGMLGYGNLSADVSGNVVVELNNLSLARPIDATASRHYMKYGAKVGWRFDFGSPGGFTVEPSFGYYGKLGFGDTIDEQLSKSAGGKITHLDDIMNMAESFVFIGGPRISLAFGFRF